MRFEVGIPRHFREVPVYLSGNHVALGHWNARAVPLERTPTKFVAVRSLEAGQEIEFKASLGDWDHAEVSLFGEPVANRRAVCYQDCTVAVSVQNFKITPLHPVPVTAGPGVFYHHELYFHAFKNFRTVAVYLPPNYFKEPERRFPVLYALDGNNLFDWRTMGPNGVEWHADETLDHMITSGELDPLIVVGIYSTARRTDEYLNCEVNGEGGGAEAYMYFLRDNVKPMVDKVYRTLGDRENTGLMGASFGGNFTLFGAVEFGESFSRFIAWSPGYFWGNGCTFKLLESGFKMQPKKIWVSMGDREGESNGNFCHGVEETEEAYRLLLKAGLKPGVEAMKFIEPGGLHNENYWGPRLPTALRFAFPPRLPNHRKQVPGNFIK